MKHDNTVQLLNMLNDISMCISKPQMNFKNYVTVQRKGAQPSFFSDHLESQQILYFYVKVQ